MLFNNDFRDSLHDPDACAYGWVQHNCPEKTQIMRHQGGGSKIFLNIIIGTMILRPSQVTRGIKVNLQR